jgi:hypothetical protein
MKRFLLILVVCWARLAFSQGSCSNFAGGSCPANIPSGVTWFSTTNTGITFSVSDTQSLTYSVDSATRQVSDTTTDYDEIGVECFHSTTTSSAAADTVSVLLSTGYQMAYSLYELSSTGGTVSYQTGSVGVGTTATNVVVSPGVTPTQNGAYIIAASEADNGSGITSEYTAGTNFTINSQYGSGDQSSADEYYAQTTAALVTANFTLGAAQHAWVVAQTVFIP